MGGQHLLFPILDGHHDEGGFVPPVRRVGIARLAEHALELDQRNEVDYREIACRSLLVTCDSPRVPFELQINPYRGCEFGCAYCYARYTHEFMELRDWRDFERRIFVKTGAANALRSDLRKLNIGRRSIAIGTATDPYQPAERRYGVMRELLEVLAARQGLRISITTKSDLVVRDVDLLLALQERNSISVNVTVTTMDGALARRLEPRAPRPDRRMWAVSRLADAGIRVGVFAMPLMPYLNDSAEGMERLFEAARDAGAHYLAANILFLRASSRARFFPFLDEEFPSLAGAYRRLYGAQGRDALSSHSRHVATMIDSLRRRFGLARGSGGGAEPPPLQTSLMLE